MDPISFLAGAVVLLAGVLIGRLGRRKSADIDRGPRAVCEGCVHGLSYHDEKGKCHGTDRKKRYNSIGSMTGYYDSPCTCQSYVGHIPAERMLTSFTFPSEESPPNPGKRTT